MNHHRCEHTHTTLAELHECLDAKRRADDAAWSLMLMLAALVALAIGYWVWG